MKKLYDIRINPKPISSEEIEQKMDFDALLKQFEMEQEQPKVVQLRRRPSLKRWALMAASFVAFVFVTYAIQQTFFSNDKIEQVAQPFINPPIKIAQKPFINFEVDAQKGGVFTMEDGTKIFIPKDAFSDAKGRFITGMLVLKYRKYQDISDIFLSGIPMQYDSANVGYNMASVGMMELYGHYNGQLVNIHPDKSLSVDLVTQTDLTKVEDYNVYQLDTVAKNWSFVALDDVIINLDNTSNKRIEAALAESEIVKKLAIVHNKLKRLEAEKSNTAKRLEQNVKLPNKPIRPHTPNPNNFVLELDVSAFTTGDGIDDEFEPGGEYHDTTMYNANQTLEQYAGVMWEVSANQKKSYDIAISGIEWRNVNLEKIDNQRFKLMLFNNTRKIELIVFPILNHKKSDKAIAKYNQDLADYEAALTNYKNSVGKEIEGLEEQYATKKMALETELAALQKDYNKARIEAMHAMNLDLKNQTIVNRFKVKQFGIWNCDKPKMTEKRIINASFQDKNGQTIDYYMVYVADKNNGQVQRFYTNQHTKITYNPNSENVLWLVSKTGKMAVAKASEFKKIGSNENFTFTLEKMTQPIHNKEDVKAILGL